MSHPTTPHRTPPYLSIPQHTSPHPPPHLTTHAHPLPQAKEEGKDEPEPVDPVMKTEYETLWDYAVQNDTKPLWLRSPKEVSKEEYESFFKGTFREFLEPAAHSHFSVEGTIEFTGLLFIPGMAPFEQGDPAQMKSRNIRLYVKRVFISDEFDDNLMPRYLNFIKGIVDSSDLPLNVSREILQV